MRYFDALVSPVAVFAAGHRKMYNTDMHKFDVLFRRLFRTVARLPAGMDWTRPWDETCTIGMIESMNVRSFMA